MHHRRHLGGVHVLGAHDQRLDAAVNVLGQASIASDACCGRKGAGQRRRRDERRDGLTIDLETLAAGKVSVRGVKQGSVRALKSDRQESTHPSRQGSHMKQ